MKSTGIVRKIDDLGRVVVPKELRRTLDIKEGDPIEIFIEGDVIILKKYKSGCYCCGEMKELTNVLGFDICPKCLVEFKKAVDITDKLRKED